MQRRPSVGAVFLLICLLLFQNFAPSLQAQAPPPPAPPAATAPPTPQQLDQLLAGEGEVGKRLDFLLQEMNRESNTILSKTGGIGEVGLTMTDLALAAKAEIDKIREQSLNLE